ncbi:hypothetical protein D3C74_343080 [compost metagenome]
MIQWSFDLPQIRYAQTRHRKQLHNSCSRFMGSDNLRGCHGSRPDLDTMFYSIFNDRQIDIGGHQKLCSCSDRFLRHLHIQYRTSSDISLSFMPLTPVCNNIMCSRCVQRDFHQSNSTTRHALSSCYCRFTANTAHNRDQPRLQ